MPRHDLTDREFNAIRHLLRAQRVKRPGRPWADHRTVINGVLWILKPVARGEICPVILGNGRPSTRDSVDGPITRFEPESTERFKES